MENGFQGDLLFCGAGGVLRRNDRLVCQPSASGFRWILVLRTFPERRAESRRLTCQRIDNGRYQLIECPSRLV